jgi:membrane fusion protein (multidrug efflux system)
MHGIGSLDQRGPVIFPAAVCLAAAALLLGAAGCAPAKPPPAVPPPPPDVQVMNVTLQDVPIYQEWIGSLDGSTNAQIRAQVSGYLVAQKYKEGSVVKKGDVLFQIDRRVFQAALDQANAQLAAAQAQLGKTELDVKRLTPLAKQNAVSQEEMDDAVQANLAAKASVEAAKASVEQCRLNLDFTDVTSLIDGIAGTAQAQIGDLIGPGSGVLTTVSTVDPIRAYFNISEQSYLAFCHQFTNAAERGASRSEMELQLILSDGSVYPLPGSWFFTGRQVDGNTGTLQVAGLFPNPDNILRPGLYARVRARTEVRHGVVLVPQRAVTELQGSYQVDVVANAGGSNLVSIRPVKVGHQISNQWIIETGLQSGETVIVDGLQKAQAGKAVHPQPIQAPAPGKG